MSTIGVILDLGKVLVDFDHGETCRRLAGPTALDPAAIHRVLFGPDLNPAFETGRLDEPGFAAGAVAALARAAAGRSRVDAVTLLDAWARIFTRHEANLALLGPLAAAFPLLLLSNTNPTHFREVLRLAPEVGRIPAKVLSHEVGLAKPDPAIYRLACARLGRPPRECVFVDDREENLVPAAALGIRTLRHPPGADLATTLARAGLPRL